MGNSKMDSSAVYALFEELKEKIDEPKKNKTTKGQTGLMINSDEIISLIQDFRIKVNQQQLSPEQIKNLEQISEYSIIKVN